MSDDIRSAVLKGDLENVKKIISLDNSVIKNKDRVSEFYYIIY